MYPIMLNLVNKKIIIVGGGKIALRKTRGILKANGKVTVISPSFLAGFQELEKVNLVKKKYTVGDINEAHLIFACTDSKEVNQQIVEDASEHQWVNNCGQKEISDFFNMNLIEDNDYLIALSSYGKNPTKIKELKKFIEMQMKSIE